MCIRDRIEAGEDHLQALKRELIEELGFTAVLGQYYGQADEYFYSSHRDTYYYNPAYIYEVLDYKEAQKPLEDFNNLADVYKRQRPICHLKGRNRDTPT